MERVKVDWVMKRYGILRPKVTAHTGHRPPQDPLSSKVHPV